MNVQFFYPDGGQVDLRETNRRAYRGPMLPGGDMHQSRSWAAVITVQEFRGGLVNIGHRLLDVFTKLKLSVREPEGVRLEAILSGEAFISAGDGKRKFRAGEYRITDVPLFQSLFKKDTACSMFVSYYPPPMLQQLGVDIAPCPPQRMPHGMATLIHEMLRNPYADLLLQFYYENCVRELLFFHLTKHRTILPGELTDKDTQLIYETDAFMAANLQEHHSIEALARMMNTNSLKLKEGFSKVYHMGVFERLTFRRMEHAKVLLETTNMRVKEIAPLAGYGSTAAFIHAFRRIFGLTPREWQQQAKSSGGPGE